MNIQIARRELQSGTRASGWTPKTYLTLPRHMVADLRGSPVAVGLYSLIARLYLISHEPIPLSTSDVQRYDPSLSRGAVIRALHRLVRGGWLVATEQLGRKTLYTPTWGKVGGTPQLWQIGIPSLGRPRHIATLRIDRRLLDTYLGKLTPHPTHPALVARYITQPLIGLCDVGAYALALAGHSAVTVALVRYGLVSEGQVCPVPNDQVILAVASQRTLEDSSGTQLTDKGLYRLGWTAAGTSRVMAAGQPLFFVPPEMIGDVIGGMIGNMIGYGRPEERGFTAAESTKSGLNDSTTMIPWTPRDQGNQGITPPITPPQDSGGMQQTTETIACSAERCVDAETARALQSINVRPHIIAELADQPIELVQAIIADGRSRRQVRDLAGWVVAMLRDARDHGWRPSRQDERCRADEEERRVSFARAKSAGIFVSDDPPALLEQPQTSAVGEEVGTRTSDAPVESSTPLADLTSRLRSELRARTYPELHPLIERLIACGDSRSPVLCCTRSSDLPVARARLLPLLGAVLRELGYTGLPRLMMAPTNSPDEPADDAIVGIPGWLPADIWSTLPSSLRCALRGSTLLHGAVQGATPYQSALLQSRYSTDVAALLFKIYGSDTGHSY